jgi:hypothetical protein
MLAKLVADQALSAGQILCCASPNCVGEIQADDRCDACGQLSRVEEPSWRLWLKGRRRAVSSRRRLRGQTCRGCNCLYFQNSGDCPGCGRRAWNPRPTCVWVPSSLVPLEDGAGGRQGARGADLLSDLIAAEKRRQFAAWVERLPDSVQAAILRGLVLEGKTLDELASEQGLPQPDAAFSRRVSDALEQVPLGLLPHDKTWGGEEP